MSLQLPDSLLQKLDRYRTHVWRIKLTESLGAAALAVLTGYLLAFLGDRWWDVPSGARWLLWGAAAMACALIPWQLYRWIWCRRTHEQVARLLGHTAPAIGDRLLGVLELVHSDAEQARSPALCRAAVEQVAHDAADWDLPQHAPKSYHRRLAVSAGALGGIAVLLAVAVTPAAWNAWQRFLAPWSDLPRYTFAAVERLPGQMVVPHGEPFTLSVGLQADSWWRPHFGRGTLGGRMPIVANLAQDGYAFQLPAQLEPVRWQMRIGDATQWVELIPTVRPELTSLIAQIQLPDYLQRPNASQRDVRGGAISIVAGSRAQFTASVNRDLAAAMVNDQARTPTDRTISSPELPIDESKTLDFSWRDVLGLSSKEPFRLSITRSDDEAPVISCEGLARQQVVLDSQQLQFKVKVNDDFGIRRVGMEWQPIRMPGQSAGKPGEQMLAAGGAEQATMDVAGTFTATALGIEPQPLQLRLFAEDYLPGRERVYSSAYVMYVLNAEDHAIWLTEQLNKWHRQALEVRDRELQLYETNKQLRELSPEDLDQPETRKQIERQAAAEQTNGRRLTSLTGSGEDLIRQASRNPEFGVGHLEQWAEMLQILRDISSNRMPSVSDLLREAAQAPQVAANRRGPSAPAAGSIRRSLNGKPGQTEDPKGKLPPAAPQVVDAESNQQPPSQDDTEDEQKKKAGAGGLKLPVTTLAGDGKSKGKKNPPSPAGDKMEQAVERQRDLLAEFDRIANELNKILANLEGSTLVKRLKAASRQQLRIAGSISDMITAAFGRAESQLDESSRQSFRELSAEESTGSIKVSYIMDDLQAYFERRPFVRFRAVLDDMKKQDVVGNLRQLADELPKEHGLGIAQCEFWSDSLDRWAEDLVDPAGSGSCPGCKSSDSLPPSVVLEVLQILEGEVNLREDTRVTEQARTAVEKPEYGERSKGLAKRQETLGDRVAKVTERIRELPEGGKRFAYEINLLNAVHGVMGEAREILGRPDTGSLAVAAETEAIELLLQSKRINPKGGGGGGSSPGGGGGGTTTDSAIALLGKGANTKEVRQDRGVQHSSGTTGTVLPEEFRAGLDQYLNRLAEPEG